MRVGYDSTNPGDCPTDGDIYLGYINGYWPTYLTLKKRYPHRVVVPITVNSSTLNATVIDCENGDATVTGAGQWAKQKVAKGNKPTIYCSWSVYPMLLKYCEELGLKPGKNVFFWIAWYTADGSKKLPKGNGIIGRQWAAPEGIDASKSPGHYDISVFKRHWPGVDPEPKKRAKKAVAKGWSWFRNKWFWHW